MTNLNKYYPDCRYFRGDIPCRPHKFNGYHCETCPDYSKTNSRILIIKLGAIGDVIRTTPLLTKIKDEEPNVEIWWLTYSTEIVPSIVDKVLAFTLENIITLKSIEFSKIINLDKDYHACALAEEMKANQKLGFTMINGKPTPANESAVPKFLTGLFDDINKGNNKSYLEEIFEICGWKFEGQEYILEFDSSKKWDIPSNGKKIIGLNTGCGARWVSRLWDNKNWIELIGQLKDKGYFPILLGGKQEDENNRELEKESGAFYAGYFSLQDFITLMNQCDCVVSAVTMGMHIAIGLKKPLILMNNIFNPNEFELYGRGEIVMPEKECKCFFSPKCQNDEYFCMDSLKATTIFDAIERQFS